LRGQKGCATPHCKKKRKKRSEVRKRKCIEEKKPWVPGMEEVPESGILSGWEVMRGGGGTSRYPTSLQGKE